MVWLYALLISIPIGILTYLYLKKSKKTVEPRSADIIKEELGHLHIYFGTQTGKSESYARQLAGEARRRHFTPHLMDLDSFQMLEFKRHDYCVIICSTQGEGEPPDNAKNFVKWLIRTAKASKEKIHSLNYAVFGVGSSSYKEFNTTGMFYIAKTIDNCLAKLGAQRVLGIGLGDEIGPLEDQFKVWMEDLWKVLPGRVKESRRARLPSEQYLQVQFQVHLSPPDITLSYSTWAKQYMAASNLHLEVLTIKSIKELKKDPEDSALHVELDGTDLGYVTAMNLGIFPENDEELVRELADIQGYELDKTFSFIPEEGKLNPFPTPCTVRDALVKYCDLTSLVRKRILKDLATYSSDPEERKRMEKLASFKGKNEFVSLIQEPMSNVVEILKLFPSVKVPIEVLVQILERIHMRYYTISSSSLMHPNRIHLTVAVQRDKTCEGKVRKGLCSGYLQQMHVTGLYDRVRCIIQKSIFKFPSHPTPIYMVCNGCGLAPFRALLQEMKQLAVNEELNYPETHLYFGCKNRATQFLYKRELENYITPSDSDTDEFEYKPDEYNSGPTVLSKLYAAFSRDQASKVYVQDILFQNQDAIWTGITEKCAILLLCGSTAMCKGVQKLLKSIATEKLGDEEKADDFLKSLADQGRYAWEQWG